ncbi:MFS transporter [Leucobacter sp. UT-8R-CII-1-4]|uniref:MFS transporter n=1 Tax=Leucobacter sp. UT-8R-CII-1-4 TaxID=3040075 RepID=UPI0024A8DCA6|nr:MFS transporter [Leucobacter sp. UT-8R-CII-1-4]MDI6022754.1 MFS transporter [Leucobacter sp. UT-8R-CII-1-4]
MIYGPTVLFALGEGAVIPLIPVLATNLGADLATAGLVASALVVGQLCGNFPAGWLVMRLGERLTMAIAGTAALFGVLGLVFAPNVGLLSASVFLIGMCAAAFALARHAFMTAKVPFSFRARALALLGGSFRLGMFIGPFLAAGLLSLTGTGTSAAWCFAVCLVASVLLVLLGPDPEQQIEEELRNERAGQTGLLQPLADTGEAVTGSISLPTSPVIGNSNNTRRGGSDEDRAAREGVFRTMATHRKVLARLGVAAASLSAVRSARQVVLPLWGLSIGLDPQSIALVIGISGAIDFALFYASGQVMDRFGRLWAVLPAMLLMGAGFLALALTHDSADASMWFAMFAAVIGVGNGLSSGILMTLGADVAPQDNPAAFLSSWRTLNDAGGALAPVVFSALAAVSTLSIATGAMGAIALLGAFGFWRWVPMFVRRVPGPSDPTS